MLNGKHQGYTLRTLERAIATNVAGKVRDCGVRVYVYVCCSVGSSARSRAETRASHIKGQIAVTALFELTLYTSFPCSPQQAKNTTTRACCDVGSAQGSRFRRRHAATVRHAAGFADGRAAPWDAFPLQGGCRAFGAPHHDAQHGDELN